MYNPIPYQEALRLLATGKGHLETNFQWEQDVLDFLPGKKLRLSIGIIAFFSFIFGAAAESWQWKFPLLILSVPIYMINRHLKKKAIQRAALADEETYLFLARSGKIEVIPKHG